jgi:hypothetical protein
LYIFLAEWIYNKAFETRNNQNSYSEAKLIQQKLTTYTIDEATKLLNANPLPAIMSLAVLHKMKVNSEVLERLSEKIYNDSNSHRATSVYDEIRLFRLRYLIHKIYYSHLPIYCNFDRSQIEDQISFLSFSKERICDFISHIDALSLFGLKKCSINSSELPNLYMSMSSAMFYCLKEHNLEPGLILLRCMKYLYNNNTIARSQGLDFVISQQKSDGSFEQSFPEFCQASCTDKSFDHISYYSLPMTVSAIWTLAETINPAFIFFGSI